MGGARHKIGRHDIFGWKHIGAMGREILLANHIQDSNLNAHAYHYDWQMRSLIPQRLSIVSSITAEVRETMPRKREERRMQSHRDLLPCIVCMQSVPSIKISNQQKRLGMMSKDHLLHKIVTHESVMFFDA